MKKVSLNWAYGRRGGIDYGSISVPDHGTDFPEFWFEEIEGILRKEFPGRAKKILAALMADGHNICD